MPTLPINLDDAARSEIEIEKAIQVLLVKMFGWFLFDVSYLFFSVFV